MGRPDYYGFRYRGKATRRKSSWLSNIRLGALFAILVGVNVYVFFFRGGTSIQDVLKASALSKKAATVGVETGSGKKRSKRSDSSEHGRGASAPTDDSILIKGTLEGHLGLSSALAAHQIETAQINSLIAALRPKLNFKALRPEQRFELRLDPKSRRIRGFVYHLSPIASVVVSRTANGALKVKRMEKRLTTRQVRLGGRVVSSLDQAMTEAGESSALVSMFVDLFSWDINWYTDPREDDEFRIIVEKKFLGDTFYRYGRILAAEYRGDVGRYQVFYFKPEGKQGEYYTPEGRFVRRDFLKMPLNFRRVSSKFNKKRMHPILHRTRGHFGVDYAAARGTPVRAVADGTVLTSGRFDGAGNKIMLQHKNGVVTSYMHLARFAGGIKRGARVTQRQVIGFVGSTGLSTGPHLHYGITVRGRHVDPLKFNVGRGPLLPRRERIRYLDDLPGRMAELEAIPVQVNGS